MTFETTREIAASVEEVFAAISDSERLCRWWGPAGFTNSFDACEFEPGGRWSFVMHGPDGRSYANENIFAAIEAPHEVVIEHASEPIYRLTISLASHVPGKTLVTWSQTFERSETGRQMEHIVVPANEQNLDRLSAEVLGRPQPD